MRIGLVQMGREKDILFHLQISHIIKSISKLQKRKDSLMGFCVLKRKSEGWGSFMVHSKKLEETMLWRGYQEKVSSDDGAVGSKRHTRLRQII